jgi:hypothetical protein
MREPEEWEPDLFANIGSLPEWTMLVGQCRACGRKAEFDPRKESGVHFFTHLVYIRNQLKCSNCGRRGGCKLLVRKLPR